MKVSMILWRVSGRLKALCFGLDRVPNAHRLIRPLGALPSFCSPYLLLESQISACNGPIIVLIYNHLVLQSP